MNIKELMTISHDISVQHGWWVKERNVGEALALVHSEVSEALEEWRKGLRLTAIYFNPDDEGSYRKPEGFPTELADILIRIADLAEGWGIDLEEAITLKTAYNRSRPHRHGGKLA